MPFQILILAGNAFFNELNICFDLLTFSNFISQKTSDELLTMIS